MADNFTTEHEFAQHGSGLRDDWIAFLEFDDTSTGVRNKSLGVYDREDIIIGRDEKCVCVIKDDRVSKQHIRIYSIIYDRDSDESSRLPPLIYCEDLQSVNGTYVNGTLIGMLGREKVGHLLCDGDVIEIGPHWKFTFRQPLQQQTCRSNVQEEDIKYFNDTYNVTNLVLGSGHSGSVYLANEISTSRQLACKIISLEVPDPEPLVASRLASTKIKAFRREKAEENKRKVLREVHILSMLSHPNIINLKKAFSSDNALYIFTDLAPAGDLFSYLDSQNGVLDDYQGRAITRQIALAIQYIHSMGIAHRDIKPENVLVTHMDFGSRVVLTDFGFAKYSSSAGARPGTMSTVLGTVDYMAPEISDHPKEEVSYTIAVDMWSFGIMTVFLLTGQHQIPRQSMLDMTEEQFNAHFPEADGQRIAEKWEKVSPRAQRFIRRLLVVDAECRMTADEAVNASWYRKPSGEATAMEDGYKRAIRFWRPREVGENIMEDIPSRVEDVKKRRRKMPDASASPYFSLHRHLNPKSPSKRRRILADLKESGASFLPPERYDFAVRPPQ
ncbi:hypothetical protein B7494_g7825 [Chlorociboria aeruginascens]|nr:hypothetical protein B7494_g7825 [Chlorociboria aeruginascens]